MPDLDMKQRHELALEFKAASDLELKALGDVPDGYIAGWASSPSIDSYGDSVDAHAFDDSITRRGLIGPKGIKLFIDHNPAKVGGIIKKLEVKNNAIWIEAQLNLNISYVKDVYEAAKMNQGLNFSIGFFTNEYSFKEDVNKEEFRHITKGDLIEVSVVSMPANEDAQMTFIKSNTAPTTLAEFEKSLIHDGLAKSRDEAQRITLAVKRCPALFLGSQAPAASEPKSAPLMDASQAKALSLKMEEICALLAPAAQPK